MIFAFITAFAVAFITSLVITPMTIRLGRRLNLYDPSDARKVHSAKISRIGGTAIFLSLMVVAVPAVILDEMLWGIFSDIQADMQVLLLTSTIIFITGLVDDVTGMKAIIKLAMQLMMAVAVCWKGIKVGNIVGYELGVLDWPVSLIWIVGITNAVNLIDGLDGLCAGICSMTCAVVATFAIVNNHPTIALLMLAMLGGLVGFLIFNFNPARIFMGDSGSMFLGFFLAVSCLITPAKGAAAMGIILPALALGLPIFDMMLAVVRRLLSRRSIFAADNGHIHHRLMQRGLSHRHAVIILYLITLMIATAGILLISLKAAGQLPIFIAIIVALMIIFRVVGVYRFKRMFTNARDNLTRMVMVRREKRVLEQLQNEFRVIESIDQWWLAVQNTVNRMGFTSISIEMIEDNETKTLEFRSPDAATARQNFHTDIKLDPEASPVCAINLTIPLDDSLEDIGRKLSLFGRLLDEHMYRMSLDGRVDNQKESVNPEQDDEDTSS